MTAEAAALEYLASSDIKQANLNTVAGALVLACDIIEDLGNMISDRLDVAGLSAEEMEFVAHARELAEGVSQ